MPSIVVAPVCILFFFGSCQNSFSGDPIRQTLDKAISEYKTEMSKLEQEVNKELTKDEDRIRSAKKGIDRARLEFVLDQRNAFNDSGEVPDTLKNKRIRNSIEQAKTELKRAFAKAEDEYLRKKEDEQIAKLELELKVLQKSAPPIEPNATLLFDGKTLDGWEPQNGNLSYLVDRGHLHCFQNVNGRLQTKKPFSNFSLKLEYQFPRDAPPAKPHRTGILTCRQWKWQLCLRS